MTCSISFSVSEKYDPTRKEIGLKVAINGFSKFKGARVRFSAFPNIEKTFSKTGSLTFTEIGKPGTNIIEVIDSKTNRVLQQIGSINSNIFIESGTGQEITIKHKTRKAEIETRKVAKIKNELIRLDTLPKIKIFFGLNPETQQPLYTKKVDKKGNFKEEITGAISDIHEIRVYAGQMVPICTIKPPMP
ncbi:MAG: hypothetical protein FK733_05010 [Asgard group archaeon]|nr:hypothetical protein [Asgard group archaeon]